MNEEMFTEIQEMVLGLIEKHSIDKASKEAQQQLQKKFGNGWNVIIGKGYGAAVTAVKVILFIFMQIIRKYIQGTALQFYYQGVYAVDIWKCEH